MPEPSVQSPDRARGNNRGDTKPHALSPFLPSLGTRMNHVPLLRLIKVFRSRRGTQIHVSFFFGRACKSCFVKPLGKCFRVSRPSHRFCGAKHLPCSLEIVLRVASSHVSSVAWVLSISAHENICTNVSLGGAEDEGWLQHRPLDGEVRGSVASHKASAGETPRAELSLR